MKGYIRPRSKGKWEITIDIGWDPTTKKRRRHYETVEGIKKDAQHRLAEIQISIEQGTYIKLSKRLTVAEWLRQWLDGYVANNLAPKTNESYRDEVRNYIIPKIGAIRLQELRPYHIQEYITWALCQGRRLKVGGLSHRTVQYHYSILSKAMNDAVKMGLIAVNPCKAVNCPKAEPRSLPPIADEELVSIMQAISESSYYLYYHTKLLTGLLHQTDSKTLL